MASTYATTVMSPALVSVTVLLTAVAAPVTKYVIVLPSSDVASSVIGEEVYDKSAKASKEIEVSALVTAKVPVAWVIV